MMQGAKVEADTLRMQMGTDKVTLITPDTHRRGLLRLWALFETLLFYYGCAEKGG